MTKREAKIEAYNQVITLIETMDIEGVDEKSEEKVRAETSEIASSLRIKLERFS